MTHVAILVPGIMGSVLELNNKVVWPGSALAIILGSSFSNQDMDKLMDPNLTATDVIRSVSISRQYVNLIEDLGRCGFRESDAPPTLYLCAYDWRKDNKLSADTLAAIINRAFDQHGSGVEISIIAHSMGGLISRYYLESGTYNARPGFSAVRRLLALATPHRGAPLALNAALGLEKRLWLNKAQVSRLTNDPRYPAVYQLMPPSDEPFIWNEASEFGQIDVYDPAIAQALKLVPANLDSARNFQAKLDLNKRPRHNGKPIRYFFFSGTRQKTVSAVTMLETSAAQYRVRSKELEDAGDGTVPVWSSALTGVQGQPVGGEHSTIYKNDLLRTTMAVLLGQAGVLAAAPDHVEVALRERVVNPNDAVHAALTFSRAVDKLNGRLSVERAQFDAQGQLTGFSRPVSLHPISYTGLNAEKLSVIFTAPAFPGVYRVAYFPSGYDDPAGSDELFVQDS
jgi:pimeloyl-ACP methyl ester carboxylesterase